LFSSSSECALFLILWDFANQEVVETFQIGCLPTYNTVNYISNLGGDKFLICVDGNSLFVLSLECSSESFVSHFTFKREPTLCVLSPDDLFLAFYHGNCTLTIRNLDNGKTMQTVVLKKQPIASWWSKQYLWVVFVGPVVVKYPYFPTQTNVLGNDEECCIKFKGDVLEFSEGVLVVRLEDSKKISICRVLNENLSPPQILDSNLTGDPEVAVSSDGRSILLYSTYLLCYEFLQVGCDDSWELLSAGEVNYSTESGSIECGSMESGSELGGVIEYGCLTGAQNCRSSLWLTSDLSEDFYCSYMSTRPLFLSSIDFRNSTQGTVKRLDMLAVEYDFPEEPMGIILAQHSLVILHQESQIYFIDVPTAKVIATIYVGRVDHFFLVPRKALLLLFRGNIITHLKIHNIDNYLPCC
jgi:hypothetical protein